MRKLLNEFFYIPKQGKIREKVMLTHVATTITIMVMCLAAMGITAYAYFSYNVTSSSNIIKAANFEANVSITITDSNNDPVTVTKNGKVQTAILAAGSYTVELTEGTSTAKTGFCIITIGDTDYYTQQIGVDVKRDLTGEPVEFTLKVSSATEIEILSHWGTSSCYGYEDESNNPLYIESGDTIDLTASPIGNDETPSTEGQGATESTTSTETSTIPPATESATPPATETTTPEATGTSEPTSTTAPSTTTTEPVITESTGTTESTETPPATETSETTGAPTSEASE